MRKWLFSLVVLAMLLPALALAIGEQYGRITGIVYSPDGATLPGVKLTLSSKSLIGGARNLISAEDGSFTFNTLAPGSYELKAVGPKLKTYTKSGVTYVASTSRDRGTVSFQFSVAEAGNYIIWARHLSPNGSRDSFFVSVDGVEMPYETAIGTWSPDWQWTRVTAPAGGNTQDPRVLNLSAGTHTVLFRGAERNCGLDRIIICNDLEFAPDPVAALAATPASADEVSATAGISAAQDAEVIWQSTPGLTYKVQGKRDLSDVWQDVSEPIVAEDVESSWVAPESSDAFQSYRVVLVE